MAHKYFGTIMRDKHVLISGSTSGLGMLMARRFLECGAKVVVMSAPFEEVEPTVQALCALDPTYQVLGYKPNLSDEAEVSAMLKDVVAKWGRIDVLINNAGIYPACLFEQYPKDLFERVFNVNVTGTFVLTKKTVEYMKHNEGGGAIINTSSMAGLDGAMANIGYTSSKFAIEGLTLGLARELGKYGIRVNAVAPAGMLRTDLNGNILESLQIDGYTAEQMARAYEVAMKFAPMGAFSSHPDEEINVFIFLASDAARFISGQTIAVSGACIWPAASPVSCL